MLGLILLVAAGSLILSLLFGQLFPRLWAGAVVIGGTLAALAAVLVLTGSPVWDWRSEIYVGGEALHFRLDGVGSFFLVLLSVIGSSGAVYSCEYWADTKHPRSAVSGRLWWSAMLFFMGIVLLSANGLQFLIGWELFTLSAYFLITLDRQRKEVRAAGWLYLAASHSSTLCLFFLFAILSAVTGSWELRPFHDRPELAWLFWIALFAFGLKAGLFPLHIWLPSAHANAPSHVSAILSGMALKMGIFGIVRFSGWLPTPDGAGWTVVTLGVLSAVLCVAFALGQHDIKRLLAYHSVENIGIILIGVGFAMVAVERGQAVWGRLLLAGALLHVWNHGLFKSLLFFGAGSVLHATGTREMSRLGGLWRSMPWTTGFFALGAVAISGLPPLNGFVSEWLIYLGLFDAALTRGDSAWVAIPAVILLGLTGALALACFVKVCGVVFLGDPRSEAAARAHECGLAMRKAMGVLAAACVVIGLAPTLFWSALARVVEEWQPAWSGTRAVAPLDRIGDFNIALTALCAVVAWGLWRKVRRQGVSRFITWDCAFVKPSSRMQYTAGSFAGILTEWFAWILLPVRHGCVPEEIFPKEGDRREHTPETVLERVVMPGGAIIMRLALLARRVQQGTVQAYLLYLLIGVIALTALVLAEG
jgi:hydrogenase-4 component B